jgi:hypothetical protein
MAECPGSLPSNAQQILPSLRRGHFYSSILQAVIKTASATKTPALAGVLYFKPPWLLSLEA